MPPLRYVDSCASIGMHGPTDARVPWTVESLLDDMGHAGVHGALVWHWLAREYAPTYGNRVLLEETAGHDRLFPCWVLVPHHAGEMAPGPAVVAEMEERGVRAAKLFPRRHGYRFGEEVCGEIFSALEDAEVPLLIDVGRYGEDQQATFAEVAEVCARHPAPPRPPPEGALGGHARRARPPRPPAEHVRRVLQLPGPLRAGVSWPRRSAPTGSSSGRSGRSRAPAPPARLSTTASWRTRTRRGWRAETSLVC